MSSRKAPRSAESRCNRGGNRRDACLRRLLSSSDEVVGALRKPRKNCGSLHPNRVWDWSDPQFLRGLRKAPTTSSLEESKRLKHASLLLPPRLQRDSADRGAFLEDIASHSRAVLDGIGRSLPSVVGVSHHLYCRTGRLGPVHQFGTLDVVNFDRQQFLAAGVPGGHPNRGDRESALRRIQISPEDHGAFARAWHLAALKELAAIGDPAIWVVRRSKPIRLVGRDHHLLGLM